MKVWCACYWNDNGHYQEWFPSKKAACEAVRDWQKDDSIVSTMNPEQYTIPTDKNGIITWLNNMCNNGESSIS